MYGLAAIQQANGWAMAGAGACIVLGGLALLAVLVSLLPRVTGLFEKQPATLAPALKTPPPYRPIVPDKLPDDLYAAASIYMTLTDGLGQQFTLMELHRQSRDLDLPQPHLAITRFRDAGLLIALGNERFCWK